MRQDLDRIILERGFVRRSGTYFRFICRTVLEVLGFSYEPELKRKKLSFGLMSLCAPPDAAAFLQDGFIMQYDLRCVNRKLYETVSAPEEELSQLESGILPLLDKAKTPGDAYELMCKLDLETTGRIGLQDSIKMYLCYDGALYREALDIADSILEDHRNQLERLAADPKTDAVAYRKARRTDAAALAPLNQLRDCALMKKEDIIRAVLEQNYEMNIRLIKKHLKISTDE